MSWFGASEKIGYWACVNSPNGVFLLLTKNAVGGYDFLSLCTCKMKTYGTEQMNVLFEKIMHDSCWTECESETEEFETAVHVPASYSKWCQHSSAVKVDYVMIIFS